ncbi:MAG: hypothetical protein K2K70_05265 [Lachnospiraceae bacterium]|nr:hypothetical protein [Lachnospiraceae bacterium]
MSTNTENKICVIIQGEERLLDQEYPAGTTYEVIAKQVQKEYPYDIILAKKQGKLVELNKKIGTIQKIEFLTTATNSGHKTYVRGVTLLMLRAFYAVCGDQGLNNVFIKYQIGDSCYCEADGVEITPELLAEVEQYMKELVHRDMPFLQRSIDTEEALDFFEKHGMRD